MKKESLVYLRSLLGESNIAVVTLDNARHLTCNNNDKNVIKFDDENEIIFNFRDNTFSGDLSYLNPRSQQGGSLNISASEYDMIQNVLFTADDPTSILSKFELTKEEFNTLFSAESIKVQGLIMEDIIAPILPTIEDFTFTVNATTGTIISLTLVDGKYIEEYTVKKVELKNSSDELIESFNLEIGANNFSNVTTDITNKAIVTIEITPTNNSGTKTISLEFNPTVAE